MILALAVQWVAIVAVIGGLGFWQDRRIGRIFRKIGERLDMIDARLAALEVKPNGADRHATQSRGTFEGRAN